ncbi:MAG: hypothetical protein ACM3Q9_00395 [Methanosarcina sp.]
MGLDASARPAALKAAGGITSLLPRTALPALLVLAALLGGSGTASAAGTCPNEDFRGGPSQLLGDCRAYEMVSPADMNGNGVEMAFAVRGDGEGIVYGTLNVFGEEPRSSLTGKWTASRGPDGWTSASLNPPTPGRAPSPYDEPVPMGFDESLTHTVFGSRYPFDLRDQSPYSNLVQSGNGDLYLFSAGSTSEWLSHGSTLPDTTSFDRAFGGASGDLSRIFFETREPLTTATEGSTEPNIYELHNGTLTTVNVDNSGTLMPGGAGVGRGHSTVGAFYSNGEFEGGSNKMGYASDPTAVSRDGHTVVFSAPLESPVGPRQVYVRVDGETVRASTCEYGACSGEGAPGGALFLVATPDGGTVLFYSHDQLLESAAVGGGIYSFDVGTESLSFLTTVGTGTSGFNKGGLLATSADLSYLYLCESGSGVTVVHNGTRKPVAPVACDAGGSAEGAEIPTTPRPGTSSEVEGISFGSEPGVTPDAGYVFTTSEALPGYENAGLPEVYLYEAASEELRCLSCRPDGSPAEGGAWLAKTTGVFSTRPSPVGAGVAVRNLSEDGTRAFFVSEDQLLPQDIDGSIDVYEWERAGAGTCTPATPSYSSASDGCVFLISSGNDPDGSVLEGVSADGKNVFFASGAQLVPASTGTEFQLFDARVEGGLASQHASPPSPCEGEECRLPVAGMPAAPTAASSAYAGEGNVKPKPKRKRCRKAHRRHGKHKSRCRKGAVRRVAK